MARAIGRSMAAMVATERHLWLNLSGIKEKDRAFLLVAPISPSGLFGDAVNMVVDRFQEAKKQSAAFKQYLPRCSKSKKAALSGRPQPSSSSSYRQVQKESVASRAPPQGSWQQRRRSRPKPAEPKVDLRTVLQARKASGKRVLALAGLLRVAPTGWSDRGRFHLGTLRKSMLVSRCPVRFGPHQFPANARCSVRPKGLRPGSDSVRTQKIVFDLFLPVFRFRGS